MPVMSLKEAEYINLDKAEVNFTLDFKISVLLYMLSYIC